MFFSSIANISFAILDAYVRKDLKLCFCDNISLMNDHLKKVKIHTGQIF